MTPRLALLASSVAGDPRSAFMSRQQLGLYAGDPRSRAYLLRAGSVYGDPFLGFIGSALGGLAKKAIGGVASIFKKKPAVPTTTALALPGGGTAGPYGGIMGGIYATPAVQTAAKVIGGITSPLTLPVAAAKYVAEKSGLTKFAPELLGMTRGAAYSGQPGRRRRRMNPLNPRALRRAITRAYRFEKFAR